MNFAKFVKTSVNGCFCGLKFYSNERIEFWDLFRSSYGRPQFNAKIRQIEYIVKRMLNFTSKVWVNEKQNLTISNSLKKFDSHSVYM